MCVGAHTSVYEFTIGSFKTTFDEVFQRLFFLFILLVIVALLLFTLKKNTQKIDIYGDRKMCILLKRSCTAVELVSVHTVK